MFFLLVIFTFSFLFEQEDRHFRLLRLYFTKSFYNCQMWILYSCNSLPFIAGKEIEQYSNCIFMQIAVLSQICSKDSRIKIKIYKYEKLSALMPN